jgi:hypothetical protein
MRAIEKFLYNLVPLNLKDEKGYDSWVKINSDNRGIFNLIVQRGAYIESVLIPLFDSLSWHSKKYLVYIDRKAIFIKKGLNYLPCAIKNFSCGSLASFFKLVLKKEVLFFKTRPPLPWRGGGQTLSRASAHEGLAALRERRRNIDYSYFK